MFILPLKHANNYKHCWTYTMSQFLRKSFIMAYARTCLFSPFWEWLIYLVFKVPLLNGINIHRNWFGVYIFVVQNYLGIEINFISSTNCSRCSTKAHEEFVVNDVVCIGNQLYLFVTHLATCLTRSSDKKVWFRCTCFVF